MILTVCRFVFTVTVQNMQHLVFQNSLEFIEGNCIHKSRVVIEGQTTPLESDSHGVDTRILGQSPLGKYPGMKRLFSGQSICR